MKNKPKVHVYLLCYNEEAIIEKVLEHYSEFCSKIFILDNYSTDKSIEIAKKFKNITVIQWKTDTGLMDDKKHIQMKTETYKLYSRKDGKYTTEVADWIIACDMDELLYHPNILYVLSDYKKKGITVPQITGFDMVDEDSIDFKRTLIEQYRYGIRNVAFDKRIIFDVNFDMKYTFGAHPRRHGFELMKLTYGYKSSNEHNLALLHYKHIGMRFMDKAKEYVNRVDTSKIVLNKQGRHQGIAAHYHQYVAEDYEKSPLLDRRKELFDKDGNILFDKFQPTTGEAGCLVENKKNLFEFSAHSMNIFADSNKFGADYLRELAIYLENLKRHKEAFNVISEARKLRENGPAIKKIYQRLSKKLKEAK